VLSEAMEENIKMVGMPTWTDADQTLAKGIQRELKVKQEGLEMKVSDLRGPIPEEERRGGGSDDIGDISWTVPTVSLQYPANIPNLPGHNWANAIAMATPIAHKCSTAGAKAQAMTMLDILMRPEVVTAAWDYFKNVQTKDRKYTPFITANDPPAIWLNTDTLAKYRPEMKKYYYDPTKYKTYLDQLGITYPTVR
jgi:aminobenzoyl-glutamate utilization protein B